MKLLDKLNTLKQVGLCDENFQDSTITVHRSESDKEQFKVLSQWLEKSSNKKLPDSEVTIKQDASGANKSNNMEPPAIASTSVVSASRNTCTKSQILDNHGISADDLNALLDDTDGTSDSGKTIVYKNSGPSSDESNLKLNLKVEEESVSGRKMDSSSFFDDEDDALFLNLNY